MSRHPDREAQTVNFRPGIPRYLQIADAIRRDLKSQGERIPSEHTLCARFRVSRPTVRQALDVLVQEGRLYRHAGRGTFATAVAGDDRPFQHATAWVPPAIGQAVSDDDLSKSLIAFIERQLNMPIKFMEQTVDAALAPRSVAELLKLRPRSPLLLFERLYFAASGEPVEYALTYQTGRRYPYKVGLSRSEHRS